MKARWLELSAKYAALSQRERAMVAVAAIALVIYVGDTLWLAPIYSRAQAFAKQTAQQEREFATLQQQLFQLEAEASVDPNAGARAALAEAKAQLLATETELAAFERTLVPPNKMPVVLENLLRERRGVRLASLKTLPVEGLSAGNALGPAAGTSVPAGSQSADAANASPAPVLMYRHGFELKLEGNYLDLAACLAELESGAQQLLWQRASLLAGGDGKSTLTLTFFTLSLDKSWIAL
jgi:MSHA biogenesis protein MshJ